MADLFLWRLESEEKEKRRSNREFQNHKVLSFSLSLSPLSPSLFFSLSLSYHRKIIRFSKNHRSSCNEQHRNHRRITRVSSHVRMCVCVCVSARARARMYCEQIFFLLPGGQKYPNVARDKPYYLLDPLLAILVLFFCFSFIYS